MTAKALASKLNERNNMLNGKKPTMHGTPSINGTTNDIPVPPLISIQTSSASNRFKDGQDSHSSKMSNVKHLNAQSDANSKPFIEEKPQKSHTSNKQHNGTNSAHHSKSVTLKMSLIFLGTLVWTEYLNLKITIDENVI